MHNTQWRVIGASVQGVTHRKQDIPCQDAHASRVSPSGHLCIAVADGAGSAQNAYLGAQCAVEHAVTTVYEQCAWEHYETFDADYWHIAMREAFEAARQALEYLSVEENIPMRSLATTLTCVVATHELLVVGQIGDGVVVAETPTGELTTILRPQRGEYANETYFLVLPDALNHIDVQVQPICVQALAVMTDGLLRLAMQLADYQPSPRFFKPLLAFVSEAQEETQAQHDLAAFLDSERVCNRTDDDKTLVLAVQQK